MVSGVWREAAGVARLRGEDPRETPEDPLGSPEAAHTWTWRQPAMSGPNVTLTAVW